MDFRHEAVLLVLFIYMFMVTQSGVEFYGCKTISVSGVKEKPTINGLYVKIFEKNAYPVFRLRDGNTLMHYNVEQVRWVIGQETEDVVGTENKLYPNFVQSIWKEYVGGTFRDNPDIVVECDDVFWTIGCTQLPFPLATSRCYNETNAIEVQDVYVIKFRSENKTICPMVEPICNAIGRCDLKELQCKRKVPTDDYDLQMAKLNCNGRHLKCHRYLVEPRYHINCDVNAEFPCDTRPDVRDGILVEYKCRRSRTYLDPDAPVENSLPPFPTVTIPVCHSTDVPKTKPSENTEKKDNSLIYYVAPAAGVLFLGIIIAVIVVTVCRRRNAQSRPTVSKMKKRPVDQRTYANIPAQGLAKAKRRPDLTDKRRKPKPVTASDERVANAAVKAVMEADPELKSSLNGDGDDVFAVVIMDKRELPKVHLDRNGAVVESPTRNSPSRSRPSVIGYPSYTRNSNQHDRGSSVGTPTQPDARSQIPGKSGLNHDGHQKKKDSERTGKHPHPDPHGRLPLVDSMLDGNTVYPKHSDTR